MLALILLIVFGLVTAYFAIQNTALVNVSAGNNLFYSMPLYLVILIAMLMGVFVSWLISMVDYFSIALKNRGKDSVIKSSQKTIDELRKENQNLRAEINRIKSEAKSGNTTTKPSFFPKFSQTAV